MTGEFVIDCTLPITNIKPKRGCVLVELLPAPTKIGSIILPDEIKRRAGVGGALTRHMEKFPGQTAIVRKLGEPDPEKPFEVEPGNTVIVRYYAGTNMRQPPRQFKMLKGNEVEAVIC